MPLSLCPWASCKREVEMKVPMSMGGCGCELVTIKHLPCAHCVESSTVAGLVGLGAEVKKVGASDTLL